MRKIMSMLLVVVMCCGLLAGCGESNSTPAPSKQNVQPVTEEVETGEDEEIEGAMSYQVSDNNVLPHNREIKLSDTKDVISTKETLVESEYEIEGLWNSSATWHVENSDYEISYNFAEDGTIQYVTYLLVDSSLSDIELGFTEVTTKGELQKLYGRGESWEINNDGKQCDVTLERNNEQHSIILKFINY